MAKTTGIMAGWLIVSANEAKKGHGFVIENGKIVEIVPNEKLMGKEGVIDAREHIVCPTFACTHTHMYETIAHGAVEPNLSLKPLLEDFWWPVVENRQTLETIRITSEYASLEHLKTGVTLINDILEAPFAEAGKRLLTEEKVLRKAGIKGVLSLESNERISTENGEVNLKENQDFILAMRETGSRDIRGTICTHTTFSCSVPFLMKAAGMARDMDEYIQIHMNEGPDEDKCCFDQYGMTTAELYKKIGFWEGGKAWANQCSCMEPVELNIMGTLGVGISTQPRSNALCNAGIAPVSDMLKNGINVGLGTDNGEGNFFENMRYLALMQMGKNYTKYALTPLQAFEIATEMGPKGLGFTDVGALRPGYSADFQILTGSAAIYLREENVVQEVFWRKEPEDIKEVYVNGELVARDGRAIHLDETRIRQEFKDCVRDFWKGQPYQLAD
ncbi:amidohydrolase family protein [uncultured Oscillibacter sp.]|uniref:amidohydrolase family protein n=1 Tax=uncultured Oscillibacter sp. TaxID=876091 RepID=UPI0026323ADF|nr:amidohydrolase family protein [uncultured Oscillibacter sp.]